MINKNERLISHCLTNLSLNTSSVIFFSVDRKGDGKKAASKFEFSADISLLGSRVESKYVGRKE